MTADPSLRDVYSWLAHVFRTPPLAEAPALAQAMRLMERLPPGWELGVGAILPPAGMAPTATPDAEVLHWLKQLMAPDKPLTRMNVPPPPTGTGHLPAGFNVKALFRH